MDWLKLSENKIGARYFVNENGKPVNLFGMARCQGCCATEERDYGGVEGVCTHFKNLGCNIIRLAIYLRGQTYERGNMPITDMIELCGGYNEEGIKKFVDTYVDPEIQIIKKHGMYIMLDLHDYPPVENDMEIIKFAREHYIPIWKVLAEKYKDDPAVAVFEIWNEPYPADVATALKDSPEWVKGIREFFFDAVRAIREIDKKHIIMVSDYNAGWGKAWDVCWKGYTSMLDPECDNTCYSIHLSHKQLEVEAPEYGEWLISAAQDNNVCLVYGEVETEHGISTNQGIKNLIDLIISAEETHHLVAVLWRPHNDSVNYVKYWTEPIKKYIAKNDI